jgi:hypothetical protein
VHTILVLNGNFGFKPLLATMQSAALVALLTMLVGVQSQQVTINFASNECAGDAGRFFLIAGPLCFPVDGGGSRRTECRSDGDYYATDFSTADCTGMGDETNFTSPFPCTGTGSQTYCVPPTGEIGVQGKFAAVTFSFSGDFCTTAEVTNVVGLAVDFCDGSGDDGTSTKLVKEGSQYVEYTYAGLECAGTPTDTDTKTDISCVSFAGNPGKAMFKVFDPPVSFDEALAAANGSASGNAASIPVPGPVGSLLVAMMAVLCILLL